MRTVLVTGGAGFIGSHLVEALVERGDQVRVLDDLSTGHRSNLQSVADRVDLIVGNITDASIVEQAVEGVDVVFHQAALASVPRSVERPMDTHAACVTGTLTVLDAARRSSVKRLVFAASSSAYGDQPFTSKRETDLPTPISPYAAAKLAGEYYCQSFTAVYGLETVCLRYFNVFGPRQDPGSPYSGVISLFITAILSGEQPTVYGDGLQSRDFCYVGNVVQANLLAAEASSASGLVFNIGSGESTTLLRMLKALGDSLGVEVEPIFEEPRQGDVRESLADITLARKHLGYEPAVMFEEGLKRSIGYYRSCAQ